MSVEQIDLQALVPAKWDDPGILLTIYWQLRFSGESGLAVRIAERRSNYATGRDLKPRDVITLVAKPDETLPDLLRMLARCFEQGQIDLVDDGEVTS